MTEVQSTWMFKAATNFTVGLKSNKYEFWGGKGRRT